MQDHNSTAEAALLTAESERLDGMARANADALEQIFHSDLRFIHASGRADTKSGYLGIIRKGEGYASIDRRGCDVNVRGNVGWITGRACFHSHKGTEYDLRYTAVWIHEDDRWQLIAYTSTYVPEAERNKA